MTAPFAAIEARINKSAFARLSNAAADFGGGVVVNGFFDAPYAEAFGLIGGNQPVFTAPVSDLPAVTQGTALAIGGVSYTVAAIHPDGIGVIQMLLEKA